MVYIVLFYWVQDFKSIFFLLIKFMLENHTRNHTKKSEILWQIFWSLSAKILANFSIVSSSKRMEKYILLLLLSFMFKIAYADRKNQHTPNLKNFAKNIRKCSLFICHRYVIFGILFLNTNTNFRPVRINSPNDKWHCTN